MLILIKFLTAFGFSLGLFLGLAGAQRADATTCPLYPSPHQRFGFNFALENGQRIADYGVEQLHAQWYLDYAFHISPTRPAGMEYAHLLRAADWRNGSISATLAASVAANPGNLWIIGNEPDRYGQDGLIPAAYATFYHEAYQRIKTLDPTSRVAVAAIVQATPLRLRYLDQVLAEYHARYGTPMPVEIWTVHGFILPECNKAGCWGASIPPGLEAFADEGQLYSVVDHGDLAILEQHLRAFRQWMAEKGYRHKPLILSEFGILLPPQLGYSYPRVRTFMRGSFDLLRNLSDEQTGYPADGDRLVQSWSWFSLNYPPYSTTTKIGFNGNLFDPVTQQILPLGQDYAAYTAPLVQANVDLAIADIQINPPYALVTATTPVSVVLSLVNGGSVAATNVAAQLWLGEPNNGGVLLGASAPISQLVAGCQQAVPVTFDWQPPATLGAYQLYAQVQPLSPTADDPPELDAANNIGQQLFLVVDRPFVPAAYMPLTQRYR